MNGRTKGKHERQEWKEVSGNVVPSVDANIRVILSSISSRISLNNVSLLIGPVLCVDLHSSR
jgi:hypothetical protein